MAKDRISASPDSFRGDYNQAKDLESPEEISGWRLPPMLPVILIVASVLALIFFFLILPLIPAGY